MNDLEKFFYGNDEGPLIHKWLHYFDIYERHFNRFRGREINILEIGIFHGGSIKLWQDYFGTQINLYAVDINPTCKNIEEENVHVFIGSQSDRDFLRKLKNEIPIIDILIDDGGHTMEQQIVTFEELYDHVDENGVYLCEDLHTSYWAQYGGGHQKSSSFIEYSKRMIDKLNAWHFENTAKVSFFNKLMRRDKQNSSLTVDSFTKTTHSLHYYDSVLVIEKKPIVKPEHRKIGKQNPVIEEKLSR